MALTEEQMREFGERLVPLYQELEQNVISDIARRVKKTGRYTETAEIMAKSLMELGYSPAKIQSEVMKLLRADNAYKMAVAENTKAYKEYVSSEIARVTATAREEGNTIVAEAGNMAFNNDLSLWEQTGKSLSEPGGLRQLIDAMALQTNGELRNLTKSMGFKGMGFTAVENVYQHQLDIGLIKLTSGAYSWEQVVNDCVHELAQSGLRSIDYKSGRTMQLDIAVRNCIMTASSQLAGKVTMLNMETTGETLVEVSQHWGARSDGTRGHGDHAYWQGKVYAVDKGSHKSECRRLGYAIRNLEEATGYPSDPKGLHGYNCRHTMYPFFEGISEPNQWEPEPEPVTVNGKEYTYYQATQKQRQMERQIRATKREIEAQKAIGGDISALQSKLRKQTADYKQFSAAAGVKVKNNRLRVESGTSNLNKKGARTAKQKVEKPTNNAIINNKQSTYVDKSTKAEATSYLKNILGVQKTNLNGLSLDVVNELNRAMTNIYDKYPNTQFFIQKIAVGDTDGVAGACLEIKSGKITSSLILNASDLADMDSINKMIETACGNGYWTKKDGLQGILEHEIGHVIEAQNTFMEAGVNAFSTDVNGYVARWQTFQKVKNGEYANRIVTEAFEQSGIALSEKNVKQYLSGYAWDDYKKEGHLKEAFAEAISDSGDSIISKYIKEKVR